MMALMTATAHHTKIRLLSVLSSFGEGVEHCESNLLDIIFTRLDIYLLLLIPFFFFFSFVPSFPLVPTVHGSVAISLLFFSFSFILPDLCVCTSVTLYY